MTVVGRAEADLIVGCVAEACGDEPHALAMRLRPTTKADGPFLIERSIGTLRGVTVRRRRSRLGSWLLAG